MKSILLFLLTLLAAPLFAADRPNILWITSEDNSATWLGCYGNKQAATPRLDALAGQGLLFTRTFSNGAVCAVNRSALLNGAYAVTQGTQHMRSRYPIPQTFRPYVSYLREAGYHCTNNSKTDYNFKGNDTAIWDACSAKAHYNKRPEGKPFFAIFNLTVSHESSLFPDNISRNRSNGIIPGSPRIAPADVALPPYLPDLPEIRSDIAIYHDTIAALDQQVGKLLDELKANGLADDTIVLYGSDHGGIIPRGKRYLEDSGVRVPLLVHIPEKWRALAPFPPGRRVEELVTFIDFAPTLLSLAGLEKPPQMQGRAFLGTKRIAQPEDAVAFLYADRFDEIPGMRRGITDGSWKYIRCFTPHLPAAPYSEYSLSQAGWSAWRKAWREGKLDKKFSAIWEAPQPVECLFNTATDPMEIHNLAGDPGHLQRLAAMRERLQAEMIKALDTGLVPEPMFPELALAKPIATYLAGRKPDLPALVSLAFAASSRDVKVLPALVSNFSSPDPIARYWASLGCLILGKNAASAADGLVSLLNDGHSSVRVTAAHALFTLGREDLGKTALLAELDRANNEFAQLYAITAIININATEAIPAKWVERTINDKNSSEYLLRTARRIAKQRP